MIILKMLIPKSKSTFKRTDSIRVIKLYVVCLYTYIIRIFIHHYSIKLSITFKYLIFRLNHTYRIEMIFKTNI